MMNYLPLDIVNYILSFDRRFVIRKGKILQIKKIEKNDSRYDLLLKIPQVVRYRTVVLTIIKFKFLSKNRPKRYIINKSENSYYGYIEGNDDYIDITNYGPIEGLGI